MKVFPMNKPILLPISTVHNVISTDRMVESMGKVFFLCIFHRLQVMEYLALADKLKKVDSYIIASKRSPSILSSEQEKQEHIMLNARRRMLNIITNHM